MTREARIARLALAALIGWSAAAVAQTPPLPTPQGSRCWPQWSDAAPIVAREALAGARAVHDEVRRRFGGQLVRITLCEAAGRYHYRLVILEPRGLVRHLDIDARRPFAP